MDTAPAHGGGSPLTGSVSLSKEAPARSLEVEEGQYAASAPPDPAATQHHATQQEVLNAAQQMARSAVGHLRRGGTEVQAYIVANPRSVVLISFVGGLALIVMSLFNVFFLLFKGARPLEYILNLYLGIFGLTIVAVDGPGDRLPVLKSKVLQYASFLHDNLNRTLFYLFIACQQGSQKPIHSQLIGWYFLFVAVAHGILLYYRSDAAASGAHSSNQGSTHEPTAADS